MPQQVGHSNQGLGNLEPVHGETTDLLPENLAEVPFVALAKETEVSRVLEDLPGAQDVLDQFPTVGSGVPGGALVVGEHDGAVGGLAVPVVFHEVLPRQGVAVGVKRLVPRPAPTLIWKQAS